MAKSKVLAKGAVRGKSWVLRGQHSRFIKLAATLLNILISMY